MFWPISKGGKIRVFCSFGPKLPRVHVGLDYAKLFLAKKVLSAFHKEIIKNIQLQKVPIPS